MSTIQNLRAAEVGYEYPTSGLAIVIQDCPTCGVPYGLTSDFRQRRREDNRTFYCPNGHSIWYGDSGIHKAKQERDAAIQRAEQAEAAARRQRERREAAERSNRALKGVVTRTKRRVGKGICPCCNRHFSNVRRHMETKHPGYAEEAS